MQRRLLPSYRASAALAAALITGACTVTPPQRPLATVPLAAINSATLDQYRSAVAQRIVERNPSYVLQGSLQAMLRSLVVVSFVVDSRGQIVASSVYRTNGDDEAESTALATLRRAGPRGPSRTVRRLAVQRQRQVPAAHLRATASTDDRLARRAADVLQVRDKHAQRVLQTSDAHADICL
jgi:protein TonB